MQTTVIRIGVAAPVVLASLLAAAQPKGAPSAPVPAQLIAAKRIFIANAGGDVGSYPEPPYDGGPDRAYNSFYAAMKAWGRYELVGTPADADLLFEIRFTVHPGTVWKGDTVYSDSQFRLSIREPKTGALLWALCEPVEHAVLQANRDRNFDVALDRVLDDVKRVTALAALQANSAQRQ